MTRVDILAKKVMEMEGMYKKKYKYISPHRRKKNKEHDGGNIENVLSLIFDEVKKYDTVLEDKRENISSHVHSVARVQY